MQQTSNVRRAPVRPLVWFCAGAAVLAALYVVLPGRRDGTPPREVSQPGSAAGAPNSPDSPGTPFSLPSERAAASRPIPASGGARERTMTELAEASQSYRNTTFLLAVQAAGFVCDVVSKAQPIGEPADGWRVECPQAFAYAVSIEPSGALNVTATPWSMDTSASPVPGTAPDPNSLPRFPQELR